MKICNWYENWFDTNYYHLLYKHRDNNEAQKLITNVLALLKPQPNQLVLDLACGRGRHSVFLSENNLNVIGFDLSEKSIGFAKKSQNEHLHFEIKDMRNNLGAGKFDIVFNLFTSFGYFENEDDDILVLNNVSKALKPNGCFIFDYLNANILKNKTFTIESIEVEGIKFKFSKEIKNNYIIKNIEVNDLGKTSNYTEKVKLIDEIWFEKAFKKAGLTILHRFGDYDLNPYSTSSERLILIARK